MAIAENDFTDGLLRFLANSPTPFHAVANLSATLRQRGFTELSESQPWQLARGGRYFVTRNDSSLIAVVVGTEDPLAHGARIVGAHTDSPCLKVKPEPDRVKKGYYQLGVEVYGGALLNPWFDRDLSLAGRVSCQTKDKALKHLLVDFKRPVAIIPSLAIHLDREANSARNVNAQLQLPPVVLQAEEGAAPRFKELLLAHLIEECGAHDIDKVLDFEISLYDVQPPARVGLYREFIGGARLDNLLSCYVGTMGLLENSGSYTSIMVCNDHEEVGSASHCGAQGTFLRDVLERMCGTAQDLTRMINRSLMISADNAHGVHPNFADKHDDNHGPLLNRGPVIKVNANQRYATNSVTAAFFRALCAAVQVPVQSFVVRSDMACGSTIGPITASELGVKTIDIGVPTFAMHSIRELAGARDAYDLYRVLAAFNNTKALA
ncbi:MAG: M18 family aminopeptidase [Pseudomonadota bacterium]